jgi:hypothetical protein
MTEAKSTPAAVAVSAICASANILEFRHAHRSGTKLRKMGKSIDMLETPTISPLIIACEPVGRNDVEIWTR